MQGEAFHCYRDVPGSLANCPAPQCSPPATGISSVAQIGLRQNALCRQRRGRYRSVRYWGNDGMKDMGNSKAGLARHGRRIFWERISPTSFNVNQAAISPEQIVSRKQEKILINGHLWLFNQPGTPSDRFNLGLLAKAKKGAARNCLWVNSHVLKTVITTVGWINETFFAARFSGFCQVLECCLLQPACSLEANPESRNGHPSYVDLGGRADPGV